MVIPRGKVKFIFLIFLLFFPSLFYAQSPKYLTRVYAYQGEFDIFTKDKTVTISSGQYLEIREAHPPLGPFYFTKEKRVPSLNKSKKVNKYRYFSYSPLVRSNPSRYITRVYCFEGEPLYVLAQGKKIVLKPGEYTEVREGKFPLSPQKFTKGLSKEEGEEKLEPKKVRKERVRKLEKGVEAFKKKRKKLPKYITKVYCYEGAVEVWGKKKRVLLFAGEFTQVVEGQEPTPPSSGESPPPPPPPPPPPEEELSITSVSPSQVGPGYSGTFTIEGTGFKSGANVFICGGDITISSVNVVSSGEISLNLTVSSSASSGLRDVTVTNPDGESYTLSSGLIISNKPTITNLAPNSLHQGRQNEDIVITGTNFQTGAVVSFSGTGITINSTTVNSSTQITVNISISYGASLGTRNVVVTNPDGGSFTLTGGFSITKGNYVYVANLFDDNATIIDTSDNTVVSTISLGDSPAHGEVTPDNSYAYIPNINTHTVSVISTATNTIVATINVGDSPEFLTVHPNGNYVYVSNTGDGTISVIDTSTNTVVNTVNTSNPADPTDQPMGLDVSGGKLYVALASDNQVKVFTISGSNLTLSATINLTGTNPYGLKVDPQGTYVYVANRNSDNVTVIRTSDNGIQTTVNVGDYPRCLAITSDSSTIYVTNEWANTITKITAGGLWPTSNLAVGNSPIGIGIEPNEDYLYVANKNDDTVSVVKLATYSVDSTLNAGDGAWAISIKDPGTSDSLKRANKKEVNIGDIITYAITLNNNQTGTIFGVSLVDYLPPGFKYIKGSSRLDGELIVPTYSGGRLIYSIGDINSGTTKVLKYQVRVSSGVSFGLYTNRAQASGILGGNPYNFPQASFTVKVVPDPIFDLGTIIGKVFVDSNNNGIQDKGERGLGGVKIVTEEGIVLTTDKNGKYHIPGLWPQDHLLKLDTRSLPQEYKLASRNPVLVHITEGLLSKVNFALVPRDKDKAIRENKFNLPLLKEDYFLVFLGSLDFYKLSTKGKLRIPSSDEKYENKWYIDKSCAFYLRGKIKGEYILTSSLNTNRDNKEFIRYIDPDKYYPVYGDSSDVDFSSTNTQGKFFIKIEKGKSYAMWGNYRTDFSDTQLVSFNRSLYGGKLYYESPYKTSFGRPRDKLNVFVATIKQAGSHDRFKATGGSLYYLRHKNIVPGSEKVYIEVQDRITKLGLSQVEVSPLDYEIDYEQGRLLLLKPLSSIAFSSHLISEDELINGEPNYLIVDYEYETLDRIYQDAYGVRFSHWINNNLSIGSTLIKDLKEGKSHTLYGIDLDYIFNQDNWFSFEYARSFSSDLDYNLSNDGGLTFSTYSESKYSRSEAFSFRGFSKFFGGRLRLEPYFKKLYPGFSNTALLHLSGLEIFGIEGEWLINRYSRLKFIHNVNINLAGEYVGEDTTLTARRVQTDEVSLTISPSKREAIEAAYRMVRKRNPLNPQKDEDQTQYLGLKYTRRINEKLSTYLRGQAVVEGKSNNQVGIGLSYTPSKDTSYSLEETFGNKGNATLIGVTQRINEKATLTSNIGISREGLRSSFGSTTNLDDNTQLNYNKTYSKDLDSNIISLSKSIGKGLSLDFSFERSEFNNEEKNSYRNVLSGGLRFRREDFLDYLLRIEFRQDKTSSQRLSQYLIRSYLNYNFKESFYLYLKADFSFDTDRDNPLRKENFREFSIGLAYRPLDSDKLNWLFKFAHLHNRSPDSQEDFQDIEKSTSNVFSFEYSYDLTKKIEWVQKLALKLQEERVEGLPLQHSKTYLSLNRFNLRLTPSWQVGLEYRILFQDETKSTKRGFLLEIDKYLTENFLIGCGYNFTDFSDDLTDEESYKSKGVFFKLKGMY